MVRCRLAGIKPRKSLERLVNDPYRGALHQSDVIILAPIHWEGQMLAWVGCLAHQIDIRAINPGGFNPGVTSLYQEGLRIPGIEIVEKSKIRSDIWRTILNMVKGTDFRRCYIYNRRPALSMFLTSWELKKQVG